MLGPPTSCRQVMLTRRREQGPRPGKSHFSASAAHFEDCRTPESQCGKPPQSVPVNTPLSVWVRSTSAFGRYHQIRLPYVRGRWMVFDFGSSVSLRQLHCVIRCRRSGDLQGTISVPGSRRWGRRGRSLSPMPEGSDRSAASAPLGNLLIIETIVVVFCRQQGRERRPRCSQLRN